MITKDELNALFEYQNGTLVRKTTRGGMPTGSTVGYINSDGYKATRINGKMYLVHRVIYFMAHGSMPEQIDHINGKRTDNRIENLRPAKPSENSCNSKIRSTNKSGIKGVNWHKASGKWVAQLYVNGKKMHFGLFDDIAEAAKAIEQARNKHHGEFANHG